MAVTFGTGNRWRGGKTRIIGALPRQAPTPAGKDHMDAPAEYSCFYSCYRILVKRQRSI
ncbi:MAG TPA: hypothetical protein PKA18_12080 [Ottowia sp.]|nr:hypothetical protein [Ottowia sp.]